MFRPGFALTRTIVQADGRGACGLFRRTRSVGTVADSSSSTASPQPQPYSNRIPSASKHPAASNQFWRYFAPALTDGTIDEIRQYAVQHRKFSDLMAKSSQIELSVNSGEIAAESPMYSRAREALHGLAVEFIPRLATGSASPLHGRPVLTGYPQPSPALVEQVESLYQELAATSSRDIVGNYEEHVHELMLRNVSFTFSPSPPPAPGLFRRLRTLIFLKSFERRCPPFEQEEFLEGTRMAYRRIHQLFQEQDFETLRNICSPRARALIALDQVALEAVGLRFECNIVDARPSPIPIYGARLLRDPEGAYHMQIDVHMLVEENAFLVDGTTGKPLCRRSVERGPQMVERVWTFDCEWDPESSEPFKHGYRWKFEEPTMDM